MKYRPPPDVGQGRTRACRETASEAGKRPRREHRVERRPPLLLRAHHMFRRRHAEPRAVQWPPTTAAAAATAMAKVFGCHLDGKPNIRHILGGPNDRRRVHATPVLAGGRRDGAGRRGRCGAGALRSLRMIASSASCFILTAGYGSDGFHVPRGWTANEIPSTPGRCECRPTPHAGVPGADERSQEEVLALTSTPPLLVAASTTAASVRAVNRGQCRQAAARRGAWRARACWSMTTARTPNSGLDAGTRRARLSVSGAAADMGSRRSMATFHELADGIVADG